MKAVSIITEWQGDKVLLLSLCFFFILRLLWRWSQRHHRFCSLFPARQRQRRLPWNNGEPLPVSRTLQFHFFPTKRSGSPRQVTEAEAQAPPRVNVLALVPAELNFMLGRCRQDSTGCSGGGSWESWHVWEFWTGLKRGKTVASPLLGCQMARGLRSRLKTGGRTAAWSQQETATIVTKQIAAAVCWVPWAEQIWIRRSEGRVRRRPKSLEDLQRGRKPEFSPRILWSSFFRGGDRVPCCWREGPSEGAEAREWAEKGSFC